MRKNKNKNLLMKFKKLKNKLRKLTKRFPHPNPAQTPTKMISKPKPKTFHEYFLQCIRNKTIPKATPPYFKKALEKAIKEYEKRIKYEKSGLDGFAIKYKIKGLPKILLLIILKKKHHN